MRNLIIALLLTTAGVALLPEASAKPVGCDTPPYSIPPPSSCTGDPGDPSPCPEHSQPGDPSYETCANSCGGQLQATCYCK